LHNQVIGIDQDPIAINLAKDRLKPFGKRFSAINSNFREIHELLKAPVDGIVADIGVSSMQLEDPKRGFSFRLDAPLDMRMNPASGTKTAADLLAELREEEIANMIFEYGEERLSRRIARLIVAKRELGEPIKTTAELAELVERAVRSKVRDKIHPATKTFQALRIAVNDELNALKIFLDGAVEMLKPKGRLVVITFHSLEDRIVKRRFEKFSGRCSCPPRIPVCICGAKKIVNVLTKRPVRPMEEELARNPRSRSAKLRACEKLSLS
jgi:16S rRNA (cytosine1402-N4)-methyltransferase